MTVENLCTMYFMSSFTFLTRMCSKSSIIAEFICTRAPPPEKKHTHEHTRAHARTRTHTHPHTRVIDESHVEALKGRKVLLNA